MKRANIVNFMLVFSMSAGIAVSVFPAEAQENAFTTNRSDGRGKSWEIFLPLNYTQSETIKGRGDSSVDINDDVGFGFGLGYNFNDHFQLNGSISWSSRGYDATIVQTDGSTRRYNNILDTSTFSLNGIYHLLNKNITPFVSGGIGNTHLDTNIPSGLSSTACWYDPWYGYICDSYVPTKTENALSYNAAVGILFDINRQFGIRASYSRLWIDLDETSYTADFSTWKLDVLFRMF